MWGGGGVECGSCRGAGLYSGAGPEVLMGCFWLLFFKSAEWGDEKKEERQQGGDFLFILLLFYQATINSRSPPLGNMLRSLSFSASVISIAPISNFVRVPFQPSRALRRPAVVIMVQGVVLGLLLERGQERASIILRLVFVFT